jgi:hypothetical protein
MQYQPMQAPPPPAPIPPQTQMFMLQSSPTMTQTTVEGQPMQQGQILSPVYMQVVPGSYSPDTKPAIPPQASTAG